MKTISSFLTLILGFALTAGCAAEQTEPLVETRPANTQTQGGAPGDFVFNLYRSVAKEKPNVNLAVSPYCAELLLDFARTGTAGETKAEIDKVLGKTEAVKWTESVADSPLTIAAAIWTHQGQDILPKFLTNAQKEFGASVEQADFMNNSADAVKRINAWCSEKTNRKITSLFEQLDATTRCVLAGAIHFAADWKVPFDKDLTNDSNFTLLDSSTVKTKIMSQSETMNYGETDEMLVVELPYKNEGFSMLLLLPKEGTIFSDWESKLTAETLNTLRTGMKPENVDLRMPRFTVESDLALNEPLKQLGMATAFTQDADFSKISGQKDLYLSEVRQKTFVKVDETGTEAAAVTSAVISIKMAIITKPFYANRPFLYAILKGDDILFLGRFVKPQEEIQPESPADKPAADPNLEGEGGAFS